MKKFKVHLTRDYVVDIYAENEKEARELSELYVSGGEDGSQEKIRLKQKFQIVSIKPTLNEAWWAQEVQEWY